MDRMAVSGTVDTGSIPVGIIFTNPKQTTLSLCFLYDAFPMCHSRYVLLGCEGSILSTKIFSFCIDWRKNKEIISQY